MRICQRRVFLPIAFALVLLVGPAAATAAPTTALPPTVQPPSGDQTTGSPAPSGPQAAHKHAPVCSGEGQGTARCHAHVIVDDNGRPIENAAPAGYGPANFQAAYLSGSSKTSGIVGIVDAYDDPSITSDLNVYSKQFGLATPTTCKIPLNSAVAPCFLKVNQKGTAGSYPRANSGWGLEISLDVETVHAMCPTCKILLVEANSSSFSDLMAAEDKAVAMGANVVSNSYGAGEFSGETAYDFHFNKAGVAFTFSSGDNGYGTQYPAASPYVTAVGGTSLLMTGSTYGSETAWSGAGSGCSSQETKPSWQKDAGCARRTVADVSADADPNTGAAVYDTSYTRRGTWFEVGGTSLASPIIASVYAQGASIKSGTANSWPYTQYTTGSNGNFHDVTSGSNGSCGGSYLCTAGVGYDGPTGLGTPNGPGGF